MIIRPWSRVRAAVLGRPRFRVDVWRSDVDHQWRFTVVAANGETVAVSEGYERHADAETMAHALAEPGKWPVAARPHD